jgi:hypothetical protein
MAKVMHEILLEATKAAFASTHFIAINIDEVMTIDNIQSLLIHLYVVQAWKRISILLWFETIGVSTTLDNVLRLLLKALVEFGGLGMEKLMGKVVIMGCDGSSIFQGYQTSVTL